MKTFTQPMQGLKEFEDLEAALPKLSGVIQISGCIDAAKPHMMYSIGNDSVSRTIAKKATGRASANIWPASTRPMRLCRPPGGIPW